MLGVHVLCIVLFASYTHGKDVKLKKYVINLDSPAHERWNEVANEYKTGIQTFVRGLKNGGNSLATVIDVLSATVTEQLRQPYKDEIRGIAKLVNVTVGQLMFMNILYEVTAYGSSDNKACTSIVATLPDGRIIHGRNLDYGITGLNHLSIMVDFQRGGKTVYMGSTFAGYVGLLTGMRPNQFTISADERDQGSWIENDNQAVTVGSKGILSLKMRDLLDDDSMTFASVVQDLTKSELIAPCYIIVGGLKDNEGAVITHNRTQGFNVWQLDNKSKRWFLVETNYDHWNKAPKSDDRRDPAIETMNDVGQSKLTVDTLFGILSKQPVLNDGTTYTTIMSASDPDMYTMWARNM